MPESDNASAKAVVRASRAVWLCGPLTSAIILALCERHQVPFLAMCALVPLCLSLIKSKTALQAISIASVFGLAWLIPKLEWAIGSVPGSVSGLAEYLLFAISILVASLLAGCLTGVWFLLSRRWRCSVAFSVGWIAWEQTFDWLLREWLWTTADTVRLTQAVAIENPLLQVADFGGMPLVSLLVAASNGLVADLLHWRRQREHRQAPLLTSVITMLLIVAASIYGQSKLRESAESQGMLAVVAATSLEKIDDQFINAVDDSVDRLPDQQVLGELVVLPENSSINVLNVDHQAVEVLRQVAAKINRRMVVGGVRLDSDGSMRLTAMLVDPNTNANAFQFADKRFPVFISGCEPPLIRFCRIRPNAWYAQVDKPQTLRINDCELGIGICHDVCFARWALSLKKKRVPGILLIGSEQFTESSDLKQRLLKCAQLRSIESRTPMVRCVRDGTTCAIDSRGQILERCKNGPPRYFRLLLRHVSSNSGKRKS